ncbi:MAG TPA: BACON domain-containing carbohydrate-binding protein [Bryobacteraceae bacterium]|nr:BACON domain-containing carbohydrate-binding protein [Bryobacteraceae bacterium]
MSRSLFVFLLIFASMSEAQVITTAAGTAYVVPGTGVPALSAPLSRAHAVAVDSHGNIYIADPGDQIVARVSTDGTLTVAAGNGHPGFSGDGGPATSASLNVPVSVAVDALDNLYIADAANQRIRKVSQGLITTVAGNGTAGFSGDGGPATLASLKGLSDVAVDTAGSLYIAESGNNRIRKVAGGTISTVAGNGAGTYAGDGGPATSASLYQPAGVAVDSAGNIYIADFQNQRVRKVSNGTITTVAGNGVDSVTGDGGPATSAAVSYPYHVTVDAGGNLYIGLFAYQVVRKVSNGIITTVAGKLAGFGPPPAALGDGGLATSAGLSPVTGLAVDSANNLYIADDLHGRIRKVFNGTITTVAGNGGFAGDGGLALNATLSIRPSSSLLLPVGVVVDGAGNLYFADAGNNRIRKVSGGTIVTVAGTGVAGYSGDGGPATSATLNAPVGIAFDSTGTLYIADYGNNVVRTVTGGIMRTVAGTGAAGYSGDGSPAPSATLNGPLGVAVDSSNNLYIADTSNHRIRRVSAGRIVTVAGNGTPGFTGDGGPATNAELSDPFGVVVDSAGNLYIADTSNDRVRKVTNGIIATVAGNGTEASSADGGPATSASLDYPSAVTVDSAGNLYIADTISFANLGNSNRIRKVSQSLISTVAGKGGGGLFGDGGLATNATLSSPGGLAIDSAGNLFIADVNNDRIRVVLAARPSFQAAPATLSFTATAGGAPTPVQVINLTPSVAGLGFTTSSSASWLNISPSSGTMPASLQITADPSTLTADAKATITITAPSASPSTATVTVNFNIQPASPAALGVATQSVSFTAIQGAGAQSQTLQVLNTGGGSLAFTAAASTVSGGSWLSVSSSGGTATASFPVSLAITGTPSSLSAGTYSGTVTLTGGGKTIAIPVTLSVSTPTASILLSQSALSFTAVAQGGVPLSQNFGIVNSGQGVLNWTATSSTLSGGSWLRISPSGGTVTRPYLDTSLVTVSIDPSTLGAGTYYGRIQVSATAANSPQVMTVILTVLPAGGLLGAQVFPTGLIFTGVAGVTPSSQDVQVGNPSGVSMSFVSGIIGTGLDYLPKNASVAGTQPTTLHVYPDFTNLAPGTIQHGTITLQFSDGSSQTVSVLTVVAPSATSSDRLSPHASGCSNQSPLVVFRQPQPNQSSFAAVVGQATTLDVQVTDACGDLIGPNGQPASVQANFSNRDKVTMVHVGNGIWQGTWRPLNAGTVSMSVNALVAVQGGSGQSGQSATLTAVVSAAVPAPTVTAQGVVHAASDLGGIPIAPGGLITIYGLDLADGINQSTTLPLPGQVNGTQVVLGDQALPILYTNPGQLNVQVPYGIPVNTQYQMTVQHNNTYSVPQQLVVAQAEPGIFTVNQQGSGQGSIVKSDQVTLAQPGTPATIGETVVIYCTGLGSVTPAVAEGAPPPSAPLSKTDNHVTVTIGGVSAPVAFSGLTPGIPGLYQINTVVPAGVAPGDAVPVVISVAGQTSPITPAVTMAVK